jgi:hypothetical protein
MVPQQTFSKKHILKTYNFHHFQSILGCIRHIVDERADGYKHIYDAGIVPKILPFLSSKVNQVRKDCVEVFASLVETKYQPLIPDLNYLEVMHLSQTFKQLGLMHGELAKNFEKLHAEVLKRRKHALRKTIKKLTPKTITETLESLHEHAQTSKEVMEANAEEERQKREQKNEDSESSESSEDEDFEDSDDEGSEDDGSENSEDESSENGGSEDNGSDEEDSKADDHKEE